MRFVLIYDSINPKRTADRFQIIQSYHQKVHHAIQKALEDDGYHVAALEFKNDLKEKLQVIKPDFVFNCSIMSSQSETEATAPEILQELGIPFTGSGALTCQKAFKKNLCKHILHAAGVPTPQSVYIQNPQDFQVSHTLTFPLFLKPAQGGCSFGIGQENLVRKRENLQKKLRAVYQQIKQPVILEEFLGGREFTAGILGNDQASVMPIMEICFKEGDKYPFRSFRLKMVDYADEENICPAELDEDQKDELEKLALKAYKILDCRDYARVDLRMDRKGQLYVLEVNALPSLVPKISSYAIMARESGLSFRALIRRIVKTAARRYSMRIT